MIESVYQILAKIGFTHPLHPPATHLPAGLIIGGFVFALIAWIFNRKSLKQTAHHCYILAFVMAIPTILLGLMDWQHRFGGAYLFEFKMKLVLAGILLFLLLVAVVYAALSGTFTKTLVAIYALCLVTVIGLGYFGGELVYGNGNKTSTLAETTGQAGEGAALFQQNCSACHFTDTTETKVGPGLKGLFAQDKFPISGKPVSDDGFRQLLKTPYSKMPPFGHLADEQVKALLDYLKTL
jgi:mono/diheme cytochrome c family protein